MIKRVPALLIAIALFLSITACNMPQSIFPEETGVSSDDGVDNSSTDVYSFTFTIAGQDYSLPMKFSVLSSRGWNLADEDEDANEDEDVNDLENEVEYTLDTQIASGEYSEYVRFVKESSVMEVKFYNDNEEDTALKSCKVVGVKVSSENSDIPELQLIGGIQIGSLYENVIDTYGKPSFEKKFSVSTGELTDINDIDFTETTEDEVSEDEVPDNQTPDAEVSDHESSGSESSSAQDSEEDDDDDKNRVLYYSLTEHSFVAVKLGDYNGTRNSAVSITIENDTEVENKYDYSKDLKKVPDEIELYKEPNLLGKKFSDFAFKYEENLYTLPIPVRELVNDGWEFVRGASTKVLRGTTADGIVMRKGNLAMSILVHNYDTENSNTPINCYAVSLCASVVGPNVDIMLPKGISLGSDEDDLRSVLGLTETADDDGLNAEEADTENAGTVDEDEEDEEDDESYVDIKNYDDYTVYSYIMPDDVPSVQIPVSISDIGDVKADLLGEHRKHIDVYVCNSNHKVVYIYMQNCPEYIVDEAAIWAKQLEDAQQ